MKKFNRRALALLWGALAFNIFLYMETLVNLTAAIGIASVIVLFIYLVLMGTSKSEVELEDEALRAQILLWTEGIKRLNRAAKVDQALGGENLHATKNEIAELAREYKIEKLKK